MLGIVIITHGKLSSELFETVKLIMGEQKDVVAITLGAGDSLDTLREKTREAVSRFRSSGCLVLTDVLGGSPANTCVDFLQEEWIRIICGVNLPMVISALQSRGGDDLAVVSRKVRDGAVKGIVDLKEFYQERQKKK
jgi:PTS system mannose-specific IIA component